MAEAIFKYLPHHASLSKKAQCPKIRSAKSIQNDRLVSLPAALRLICARAGTGDYHIGSPPDSRSSRTCAKYGIPTNHRARQVSEEDFEKFDYLLAMDESNLEDLEEIADTLKKQDPKAKLGKGTDKSVICLIQSAIIWRL